MSAASCARIQTGVPLLVVSAEDQDHYHLSAIMGRDCDVYRAATRQESASLLRLNRPWVVVCDDVLPDGDWRDLLDDLRTGEHTAPLIVSSRLADDRLWAEVLNLGGYDLLVKPFTAVEVSRVVEMAARRACKAGV